MEVFVSGCGRLSSNYWSGKLPEEETKVTQLLWMVVIADKNDDALLHFQAPSLLGEITSPTAWPIASSNLASYSSCASLPHSLISSRGWDTAHLQAQVPGTDQMFGLDFQLLVCLTYRNHSWPYPLFYIPHFSEISLFFLGANFSSLVRLLTVPNYISCALNQKWSFTLSLESILFFTLRPGSHLLHGLVNTWLFTLHLWDWLGHEWGPGIVIFSRFFRRFLQLSLTLSQSLNSRGCREEQQGGSSFLRRTTVRGESSR